MPALPLARLELPNLGKDVGGIELRHAGVNALETDYPLLVNDDNRPVGRATLLVVHTVELRDVALRMELRQYRVGDISERRREGRLRGPGVGAYTQDLGILLLEVRIGNSERGDLMRSTAGEREDVEGQDDVLLPPVLAKGNCLPVVCRKREIRRGLPDVDHEFLP